MDIEGGEKRGEEGGIWNEGREKEKRRMKEEGKEKGEWRGGNNRDKKLLNVQVLTEDKRKEILEETGDDSIMWPSETQKK